MTGDTGSSDFPTTPGAFQTILRAPTDAFIAKIATGGCPPHRIHGHISTVPPSHSGTVSHEHHGQHGHSVASNCPPHAPGHSAGLLPEPEEGSFGAAAPTATAAFSTPAGIGALPRGGVVTLYGPADGLYVGEQDDLAAADFLPPASGWPRYYTTRLPEVRVGGVAASVIFSGLAPGLRGAWQIDFVIPPQAPVGDLPVVVVYQGQQFGSAVIVMY